MVSKARNCLIGACILAGCWLKPPPESRGDTHISLVDGLADDICWFSLTPAGATAPSPNWMGSRTLDHFTSQYFDIKPGSYELDVRVCGGQCNGRARVRIDRSTHLMAGNFKSFDSSEASWKEIDVPLHGNCGYVTPFTPAGNCKSNGVSASTPDECCSGVLSGTRCAAN